MKRLLFPILLLVAIIGSTYLFSHYAQAALFKKIDTALLTEAMYYVKLDGKKVRCDLCPRRCTIPNGKKGFCRARENRDGTLYSIVYARPVAIHVDPIEKKPLFHVYPGTRSFSIATAGCNLACKFCQNWQISQADPEDIPSEYVPPKEIVQRAKSSNSATIAYTYTEPAIFYEYMLDIARLAKKEGVASVMHSAGFINEEPLRRLCKYLVAADIDLKGSAEFYDGFCLGSREDILRTLKIIKEEGVWLEITMLIIPTLNDNTDYIRGTCKWIVDNLGPDVPIHFSRFWPMYQLKNLSPTPVATLEKAADIARKTGLHYVYVGNVPGHEGETTYCPHCKRAVIKRIGYTVAEDNVRGGRCKFCKGEIGGVFKG